MLKHCTQSVFQNLSESFKSFILLDCFIFSFYVLTRTQNILYNERIKSHVYKLNKIIWLTLMATKWPQQLGIYDLFSTYLWVWVLAPEVPVVHQEFFYWQLSQHSMKSTIVLGVARSVTTFYTQKTPSLKCIFLRLLTVDVWVELRHE